MEQLQVYWEEMGLPGPLPKEEMSTAYIETLHRLAHTELDEMTPQDRIPSDKRTPPMTLQEAAGKWE